ncbi:purine-nucleoside phosphorylase [Gammaproteobacteria bacterium]|nr:purine-nucleoside phosphorylase [Gammaproteobacteria bacterium]
MAVTMQETMSVIRKYAPHFTPKVGLILGSGLGSVADQLTDPISIPYQAIPGLQAGTVVGHASSMVLGYLQGVPVVCLKGRLHLYEGATYESLRTFIRMVKNLGAENLIITAAAGSMHPEMGPGEIMMINDHINFQPGNPLVGPNDESIGQRFVSLENAYDSALREQMSGVSEKLGIKVHEGVYISLLGPSFETPAEIRAYRAMGADAVGMSVVPEVIVARHCGLKVMGLAAITNFAVGMSKDKVTHEGTLHYGEKSARNMLKLINDFVKEIGVGF